MDKEMLMTVFLADTIAMMLATGLCIVVVRDRLRRPLGRVLGVWLAISIGVNALEAVPRMFLPEDTMNLIANGVLVLYLVGAFLYYCHWTDLSPHKLLFMMMMVLNLFCFLVGLSEACRIPLDYSLVIFYLVVMVPLGVPSYFLLRRVLWPIVRDLENKAWRILWVIPCTFSILLIILTYAFWEASMGMHIFMLVLMLVGAFVTYIVLLTTLNHTAQQAKQAERALAASAYLSLQKDHYKQLMQQIEQTRAIRHDFRHQLLVIRRYAAAGDDAALDEYFREMEASIPRDSGLVVCDHFAANAVAVHYLSLAEEAGIRLDVELGIPMDMGNVSDGDLCVIVGNLLENALEACQHLPEGSRFIRIRTRLSGSTWTMGMDNSYGGTLHMRDGQLLSGKRDDVGVGLSSIKAAAQRYGGDVEFTGKDGVFYSSVYLVIR